jgi:hypothetical protein
MADTNDPIEKEQGSDRKGNTVVNATHSVKFAGSATTSIEATAGTELYMVALVIYVPHAAGTFYFTDAAGSAIAGLPAVTNKALTTYAGSYPFFRFKVTNGLKIVSASSNDLVASMFYSKV